MNPRSMSQSDAQLYRDLARASGGQAIEVTKSELSVATSIIEDSSASAVVRHQTRKSDQMQDELQSMCVNVKFLYLPLSGDSFSGHEESWKAR